MEEKREKQFRRIICCLLPLCLFLVWVNILPVSAQTQLSASAQIQSAAPWGTETVKETRVMMVLTGGFRPAGIIISRRKMYGKTCQ